MTIPSRVSVLVVATWLALALSALAPVALPFEANAEETTAPAGAFAAAEASGFVPLADFSGSSRLRDAYADDSSLKDFMNKLFVGAISLGAILAVLRLAWAGFVYMGTDMWGKKEHAKEIIQDTLLGLFLLLAIWLILKQINPDILNLDAARVIKDNPASGQTTGSQQGQ